MTFIYDKRREVTQRHNPQHHLDQSKYSIMYSWQRVHVLFDVTFVRALDIISSFLSKHSFQSSPYVNSPHHVTDYPLLPNDVTWTENSPVYCSSCTPHGPNTNLLDGGRSHSHYWVVLTWGSVRKHILKHKP